jgi:transcriptional regulator GlxA family with amidase domain
VLVVVFDGVQSLDLTGPLEVFHHASALRPGAYQVTTASLDGRQVLTSSGLRLTPDADLRAVTSRPHALVVPGGPGARGRDPELVARLRAHARGYWLAMGELERLGAKPVQERYVFDGKYATSAGVSAGIDMALALVAKIAGDKEAMRIQLAIEYDPHPPHDAGSPASAPEEVVVALRAASRFARA